MPNPEFKKPENPADIREKFARQEEASQLDQAGKINADRTRANTDRDYGKDSKGNGWAR